jgi:hypothetical protein
VHQADAAIIGVARIGLEPSPAPIISTPLSGPAWDRFVDGVWHHRLGGFLLEGIRQGLVAVSDDQHAAVVHLQRNRMVRSLHLDHLLATTLHELDNAGVDVMVVKGPTHAALLYTDPSLRPYSDIDLLVRGAQFADAVAALGAVGITRPDGELADGFDEHFGKGATLHAPSGFCIDLHRTFLSGPFAFTVDADGLFATTATVELVGRTVRTLPPEERLLHCAFHAALSDFEPRLITVRDVVQAALVDDLDIDRLHSVASAWQARGALALALTDAWSTLRPAASPALVDWARTYRPGPRERIAIASYRTRSHRWWWQSLAGVPYVDGWRRRATYVRAIAPGGRRGPGRSADR